jgi:hypothetical protein
VTNNEKTIEFMLTDDTNSESKQERETYTKFLELFVKLLCKKKPDQVEHWVSKPYFPVEKCLKMVRDESHRHLMGEAILLQRAGNLLEAIKIYMKQIDEINVLKLLEHIKIFDKCEPRFLQELERKLNKEHVATQDEDFMSTNPLWTII